MPSHPDTRGKSRYSVYNICQDMFLAISYVYMICKYDLGNISIWAILSKDSYKCIHVSNRKDLLLTV